MSTSTSIVVMGVSGCGKSTVGALLASKLGVPFVDGDSLHPIANLRKMADGIPLDDSDRGPWLDAVARTPTGQDIVVACSALKRRYRQAILAAAPATRFVHLEGSAEVIASRMQGRSEHFMPTSLLGSQLQTLERLEPDEPGFAVDISAPVGTVLEQAVSGLQQ